MTVSSEVNRSDFAGNGSTTNFATGFRFLQNADIKVILTVTATGVETVQVLDTDYTLTGAGLDAGGTVIMTVAPATGTTVTIKRDIDATQLTDYVENDPFPAESHENALDKLTMIAQQQQEEIDRSLKLTESQQSSGLQIPAPVENNLLRWDASGNLENIVVSQLGSVTTADLDDRHGVIFATVAAMTAANPVSIDGNVVDLVAGMSVEIQGYITAGDGGGKRGLIAASQAVDEQGSHTNANGTVFLIQHDTAANVRQYGASPTGSVATNKTAIQAAIDDTKGTSTYLEIVGNFPVNELTIDTALSIRALGQFLSPATGTFTHILKVTASSDVHISGSLVLVGAFNQNLAAAFEIVNATASQFHSFQGLHVSGALVAYKVGDAANPDALISEIMFTGCYTFACANCVTVIGAQAIATFGNCTLTAFQGGGDASWGALVKKNVICIGGRCQISGGEVQHTDSVTGSAFEVQPIVSTGPNSVGSVYCSNVSIETAARLAVADNPSVITHDAGSGLISFYQCEGAHTQNAAAFIFTEAFYDGDITVKGCDFRATVARTQPNVQADGNARIDVDADSFGVNFLSQIQGITGGTAVFDSRMVLNASNPNGQVIAFGGTATVVYTANSSTSDFVRFGPYYNAGTGEFTVPAGGLDDVEITTSMLADVGFTTGDLQIEVNGSLVGIDIMGARDGRCFWRTPSLSAGDVVRVRLSPFTTNAVLTQVATNNFHIFASKK